MLYAFDTGYLFDFVGWLALWEGTVGWRAMVYCRCTWLLFCQDQFVLTGNTQPILFTGMSDNNDLAVLKQISA